VTAPPLDGTLVVLSSKAAVGEAAAAGGGATGGAVGTGFGVVTGFGVGRATNVCAFCVSLSWRASELPAAPMTVTVIVQTWRRGWEFTPKMTTSDAEPPEHGRFNGLPSPLKTQLAATARSHVRRPSHRSPGSGCAKPRAT